MKLNLFYCALFAGGLFLTACSNDDHLATDDAAAHVPAAVLKSFNQQYYNATDVTWSVKSGYAVAEFLPEGRKGARSTAWYHTPTGLWALTGGELPYESLPAEVVEAFEATDYAKAPWRRDDRAEFIMREGAVTLYVIEVEKRENGTETEVELYFTPDGVLVKTVVDAEPIRDYEDFLPQPTETGIDEWLAANYPDARVVDVEKEGGMTEVEFVSGGLPHEALFAADGTWVRTKTKYEGRNLALLPEGIVSAAQAAHIGMQADEVTRYATADGEVYYRVELENRFGDEVDVYVDANGQIIDKPATGGDGGTSQAVPTTMADFLNAHYPGARILEKEEEHGYTVVEIVHEGVEKEVRFNGRGEWVDTTWDISPRALPADIRAVLASRYAGYECDDAEIRETADGITYEVELEDRRDRELKVTFDAAGNVISERQD